MEKIEQPPTPTIKELAKKNAELKKQNEALMAKLNWLEAQFRLSQQKKFGASSEKTNPDQLALMLFNEIELTSDPSIDEPTIETVTYRRKKRSGQIEAMLENLPTETIHYRLNEKEGTETPIVTAKMPAPMYPVSLASPSAMAYLMSQKYSESLPLYRQEKQLDCLDVSLSRQTMANWMIYGADKWLDHLYQHLHKKLGQEDVA